MSHFDTDDAQRRRHGLVFQIVGLFDLALGAAIAILGPSVFGGGDATVIRMLVIAGATLALGGLGLWWWGRTRCSGPGFEAPSGPVTRRPR
jgi:hypothetical protein